MFHTCSRRVGSANRNCAGIEFPISHGGGRAAQGHPDPSDEEIYHGLAANLCRCTGHINIVKAVKRSSELLRGEK